MTAERILVIDDEPQILLIISRFLKRLGYEVEKTDNGTSALQLLGEAPFALVLSDLKMPHMDGLVILQKVKELYPDTLFIMMTAFATIDSTISALREGVYDFLTKPLDLNQLTSTVQRALEHRALTQQNKQLMAFLQEKNRVLASLHQEEQRKAEQLRQVNAIARQITPILDPDMLVDTVIEKACQAFPFASLSFGLIDQDRIVFKGASPGAKTPPAGWSDAIRESIFWQLTCEGREPFIRFFPAGTRSQGEPRSQDPQNSPTQLPTAPASASEQDRVDQAPYDLIFPLQSGHKTVGFWVANWHPEATFREGDLSYLESLAAQTVVVLENARLYALAKRADELAFLNRVGQAANQSLDLQETIQSVLACVHTFGAPYAAGARHREDASVVEICLFAAQGSEIQQVFRLIGGTFERDSAPILGHTFMSRVSASPSPIVVTTDLEDTSRGGPPWPPSPWPPSWRSLLGVPLYFGEQQIGVLGMGSPDPGAYTAQDGHLFSIAGRQVAAAIENARLFQEIESKQRMVLESRNTLLSVFDSILDGIYLVDRAGKILAINRTQAARVGRPFSELVGKPAELAFSTDAEAGQRLRAYIAETFESGKPLACTERQRTNKAYPRAVTEWSIHTYPVTQTHSPAQGEVDHVVVVVRDVTEQRQLEASLIQSEKMAAVGQLAAGIAHEINNPLAVISANVQILREELPPSFSYFQSLELIHRAQERASKVVQDLLNFARPEQFEFMPTDLNLSLRDMISLIEPQIQRANIRIITELDPDLPLIWASPDHLRIVWLNLLLNARDAIQENCQERWIKIASGRRGDSAVVYISDNGMGMSPEMLKRLYEPFFTTKAPSKGTGLGLFTCYRTVTRHKGQIHVDSEEGKGTTFEILLPLRTP
jgi:PAS domain S-box-containing protein